MSAQPASADQLHPNTSVAPTADVPHLQVDVSCLKIRKKDSPISADKVYATTNGAILVDGSGGEGQAGKDDVLAARLVGHPMSNYFSLQANQAIRESDVETVKHEILNTFRVGRDNLETNRKDRRLDKRADTTANIAIAMRTKTGEVIGITANAGDSATFLRNDLTGEMTLVSQDQSYPGLMVSAGQMTPQEAIGHERRNESLLLSNINPGVSDTELSRQINLQVFPLPPDYSLIMLSDGPTDNIHPDHLLDLSKRFAQRKEPARVFVHGLVERARDIYIARRSPLAKPDDVSGAAITPKI